jgi:hypothetical protein
MLVSMSVSKKTTLEDWQIDAFVSINSNYYKEKWKDHTGEIYGGWNWVAFFFAIEWLVYRKMYKQAIVIFIVMNVINTILVLSLNIGLSDRFFFDIIKLIIAIWGNGFYRRKLISLLEKTKDMSKKERIFVLSKKGGINVLGLGIFIMLEIIIIIIQVKLFYL